MTRSLHTQFCDDIRQEIGNKLSIMGVYHGALLVGQFPIELDRLFVTMKASASEGHEFKQLRFVVLLNDQPLVEMDIPEHDLGRPVTPIHVIEGASDIRHQQSFQTFFQLPPLKIEQPSILRTRVITEEETLYGDGLMIIPAPQE